jgi:putative membrane protein
MKYNKILVIGVDRDADVYRKTGASGPIVGREKTLDTAIKLALADPSESDANALFEVVRIGDKLREEGKEVEVAIIVGKEKVGLESDAEISRQLEEVLGKFYPEGVIVVTDGAEDEYILPIVESKVNVISLKRVIVRQSEQLESTYFVLQEFLKDIVNDPKLSRIVVGLPGIAAILYMLLGEHGWRLTVGIIGVFLIVKGFGLEEEVQRFYQELKSSFVTGRITFFAYAVGFLLGTVGIISGFDAVSKANITYGSLIDALPIFISNSIDLLMFAIIIALIGKSIDSMIEGLGISKYIILIIFVVALRLIIDAVSLFILGEIGTTDLALLVTLGLILSMFTFLSIRSLKGPVTG